MRCLCQRSGALSGFTSGSPAQSECEGEPLAGDWAPRPARTAHISALLSTQAVVDHLRALAALLQHPQVTYSTFTIARSALDIACYPWYQLEPGIGSRERVRRSMNARLRSEKEKTLLPGSDASPEAEEIRQHGQERIDKILSAAARQGFAVNKGDKFRAPYLGDKATKPPTTTELAPMIFGHALGGILWSIGSAVAHGHQYGLAQLITRVNVADREPDDQPVAAVSQKPREAALQLIGAPVAAIALLERLYPDFGWETSRFFGARDNLLAIWHRVAEIPSPQDLRSVPATFRREGG